MNKYLKVDEVDNVLVALDSLNPGRYEYGELKITLTEKVPQKHKFLTKDIEKGGKIIMYGVPVGTANEFLIAGTVITTVNISHFADPIDLENKKPYKWKPLSVSKWESKTFNGYHRSDGKVGTANYWLFIPLVFCENRNLKVIEEALTKGLGYYKPNGYEAYIQQKLALGCLEPYHYLQEKVFKNIDGIKFLYHQGGCGGTREDTEILLRLLAGYVNHANVAGATVLSLGCQHAQIDWFKQIQLKLYPKTKKPIIYLDQQTLMSEKKLITAALDETLVELAKVNIISRKPARLDNLIVGLECGGSDGFSGITANPAVGVTSDLIVAAGGSTILGEFPELNGVEQNIIDRCITVEIAEKFIKLQQSYESRARLIGSGFNMNPSPGNIKDGLITDAIKSAGAAKKAGTSPVRDILDYAEPVSKPGLNLLCTPGNDVESTTGLAASGANIILFTTGLGTPTGNPIVPVIKISSNTALYNKMNDIIDLDAGMIIEEKSSINAVGEILLEKIIAVASGEKTKAMELEQNDFIPWKRGISL